MGKDDENEDSENEMIVEEDVPAVDSEDKTTFVVPGMLQAYKEALANDDQSKVSEVESFLLSIEDEKESYAKKVSTLSEEISVEKDRVLRIGADFDNFRKRTEKQRLSLMSNTQGEIVESLLPVLDNFERAKDQIKVETEGEEKINNSYQSIYKQFVELLNSLGVEAVETVGTTFDPMLHEAIMQEDSSEFEESIILQEFRKGFKLGDRLLRPSMVKVSSGPGPVKFDETTTLPVRDEAETNGDEIPVTESNEEDGGGESE